MAKEGTCAVEGCPNTWIIARGFCQTHYYRWRWHGDPTAGQVYGDPVARFFSHVQKGDGDECWLWTARRNRDGYGTFWSGGTREGGGKMILAHRWSYERHTGAIPEGLSVLHHCDVPACIRPDHLYAGTQLDNMRDRRSRGR